MFLFTQPAMNVWLVFSMGLVVEHFRPARCSRSWVVQCFQRWHRAQNGLRLCCDKHVCSGSFLFASGFSTSDCFYLKIYGYALYQHRITMIRRRDPGHFGIHPFSSYPRHTTWLFQCTTDALAGPVLLSIVLFVAVLANFILRGLYLSSFSGHLLPLTNHVRPFQINYPAVSRILSSHRASPRDVSFHVTLISLTDLSFKQAKKSNPLPRGWPPRFLGTQNCERHSIILFPATLLKYDKPFRMFLCSPHYLR